MLIWLFLVAELTAGASALASGARAAAGALSGAGHAAEGDQNPDDGEGQKAEDKKSCQIHRNKPIIKYPIKAQTQAIAHWNTITKAAARRPSSRRMEAMAATQGV